MIVKNYDEDEQYVMNHNDFHLYHNVNEQMNDDDDNLHDDDEDHDENDMDDDDNDMIVVVLERDFEENDVY